MSVMDWELKTSTWGFTELGQEDFVASNSSVELKLGGLGDLGDGSVGKLLKEPRGSTISSSSSSVLSKRKKAMQSILCFVDGCTNDLSDCRDYYRRHRVCERHSKTPVVIVGGKEKRFCQQCSRFQSLGEFDEEKRSCRKRLDGHNRRRRKHQPEAFYMSSGTYFSNHQGARLSCFSGSQAYPTSPIWPRVATHHRHLHVTDQQSTLPNSLACIYNGGDKQFPFLLANGPEVSISQRLINNSVSPETGCGHEKILADGLTQSVNSKRALSLLSSHPTESSETSSSHLLLRDVNHLNQPIGTCLPYNGLTQHSPSQGLVPRARNGNNFCNHIFQVAPDDCWKM